jgi:ribosomal protein L16 Arg81 hydroxylase
MPSDFLRIVRTGTDLNDFASLDVAGGRHVSVVDPNRFVHLIDEGCTASIVGVDRLVPEVATALERLGKALGGRCDLNMYYTPAGARGLDPHCDPQDVIIVQLEGRKNWRFWDPIVPLITASEYLAGPLRFDSRPSSSQDLCTGGMLYVPRGWGHDATNGGDHRSVHATIGLQPVTVGEVLHAAGKPTSRPESRRSWAAARVVENPTGTSLELERLAMSMIDEVTRRGDLRVKRP